MAQLTGAGQLRDIQPIHLQATELRMDAHHRLTGQQDPDVFIGQAEQQRELTGPLHLLNDHRGRDAPPQLRRFEADQGAGAGELQGHRQLIGQRLLGLLLKDAEQAPLFAEPPTHFFVVLKVFPGDVAGDALQLAELQPQLGQVLLVLHEVQPRQVAAKTALHQLPGLGQIVALQQVENHAVAGGELAHQGVGGTCRQLTCLTHTFEPALHRHDVALRIEAPPSGPAGHLEELTAHQRAMPPLGAFGEGRNHRAAGRHVDACRQGLRGEDHLHQPLLEELFDQLLPGGQNTGVVGRDAPQQRISVNSIPNGLGVVVAVGG